MSDTSKTDVLGFNSFRNTEGTMTKTVEAAIKTTPFIIVPFWADDSIRYATRWAQLPQI